jgi:hypothetical protein
MQVVDNFVSLILQSHFLSYILNPKWRTFYSRTAYGRTRILEYRTQLFPGNTSHKRPISLKLKSCVDFSIFTFTETRQTSVAPSIHSTAKKQHANGCKEDIRNGREVFALNRAFAVFSSVLRK